MLPGHLIISTIIFTSSWASYSNICYNIAKLYTYSSKNTICLNMFIYIFILIIVYTKHRKNQKLRCLKLICIQNASVENAAQRLSNACRQAALIESLIAFVRSGFREEKTLAIHRVAKTCHPISLHLYKYNWYPVSVCVNPSIAALHNSGLLPYTLCRKSSGRSRVALDKSSVARELQGALLSWFPRTTSLILCGCSLTTHANHEDTRWEQLDTMIHAGIVGTPK